MPGRTPAQVFLAANPAPTVKRLEVPFSSRSGRSGGLVAPDMALGGLSRLVGPISGDAGVASTGTFDPVAWFGLESARLFGALSLATIIGGGEFAKLDELPRFVGDSLDPLQRAIADLERLQRLLAADTLPQAATVKTSLAQLLTPETGRFRPVAEGRDRGGGQSQRHARDARRGPRRSEGRRQGQRPRRRPEGSPRRGGRLARRLARIARPHPARGCSPRASCCPSRSPPGSTGGRC